MGPKNTQYSYFEYFARWQYLVGNLSERHNCMSKSIHTDDYQVLVSLLRDYRLQAGLTQNDLAMRIGRKQAYVSAVEVEGRRLDLLQLRDWVNACGGNLVEMIEKFESRCDSTNAP
ncbi:helix-turn-helix domain-containing protein [Pseudomonas sp. NPDC007930]|uniref:helix-turn-helix domain-containing protein n=1 Tax=Pseudomonas sp. NPDC007930 TaxID=3364417 RepID=UPI0036E7575B